MPADPATHPEVAVNQVVRAVDLAETVGLGEELVDVGPDLVFWNGRERTSGDRNDPHPVPPDTRPEVRAVGAGVHVDLETEPPELATHLIDINILSAAVRAPHVRDGASVLADHRDAIHIAFSNAVFQSLTNLSIP